MWLFIYYRDTAMLKTLVIANLGAAYQFTGNVFQNCSDIEH